MAHLRNVYMSAGLFFLNMYLIGGVSNSFRALKCTSDNQGGSFLAADPQLACWRGGHIPIAVLGFIGVFLYLICVPAMYAYVLFRLLPKHSRNAPVSKAFLFLYGRFKPEVWYWELYEVARKIMYVVIQIFFAEDAINQSTIAILFCIIIFAHHLLHPPFVCELYSTLYQVLGFTEIMVLLMGLVFLNNPEEAWCKAVMWVVLSCAFATMCYVTMVDADGNWQLHRAVVLRRSKKVTLAPELFELFAFDDLVLDWLDQGSPEAFSDFRTAENQMMQALYGGDLNRTKATKQYEEQLKVLPYLFDNIVCMDTADSPGQMRAGGSADEHLLNYLTLVEDASHRSRTFKDARPSCYLISPKVRGPLSRWLAQPAQIYVRKLVRSFLEDVHKFAAKQAAELSPSLALKKMLITTSGDAPMDCVLFLKRAKSEVKKEAAVHGHTPLVDGYVASIVATAIELKHELIVSATELDVNQLAVKFGQATQAGVTCLSSTVDDAGDAGVKIVGALAAGQLPVSWKPSEDDPAAEFDGRMGNQQLLTKLVTALNCEMVEVIPAPDATHTIEANMATHHHVKADPLRRRLNKTTTPWSEDSKTPMGLCIRERTAVLRRSRLCRPALQPAVHRRRDLGNVRAHLQGEQIGHPIYHAGSVQGEWC